ncbi:MAG: hypothetical protein FJY77_03425 [Candidatus Altiarchaeales archaeon]|nr:hypothetical protein [Candidatus Altiarchaeales archaeon]
MAEGYTSTIRVDVLMQIINKIMANKELEAILGAPLDKHFVVAVRNGRMKFNPIALKGERVRNQTDEQRKRVIAIVEGIIRDVKGPTPLVGKPDVPDLM